MIEKTVAELSAALAAGDISSVELTQAYLDRIGKCNDALNAFITVCEEAALNQARADAQRDWSPYSGVPGVNHLAYEVDNVDSLRERLLAGGFKESTVPNTHPFRKRVYFYDPEGNDWEFIQYFSDIPAERNDYELPNA